MHLKDVPFHGAIRKSRRLHSRTVFGHSRDYLGLIELRAHSDKHAAEFMKVAKVEGGLTKDEM